MLLLPSGAHTLFASAMTFIGCLGTLLLLEARYEGIACGACQHAALPLTWRGLVTAARRQQVQSLLPALAWCVLPPLVVSAAVNWLLLRQRRRQRQRQQRRLAPAAQPARRTSHSGHSAPDPSKASAPMPSSAPGPNDGVDESDAATSPCTSRSASGSSHRAGVSLGPGSKDADVSAAPRQPAASVDASRDDVASQQDQDSVAPPASSTQADTPARRLLYKSPADSGQPLLMHLKLVGADAAAEAAFVQQLPDALASVLGDAEAAAAAWQLLHVSAFPGAWGAAA